MKKLSIALLILLVLISSAAQADVMKHVADQANTFTDREIEKLEARMTGIYDIYGFDTVIVTTRDSRGQTAQMYAADFYDEFRDYDAYPNGLIFSFNFDIGEYYEATRGMGMELFSDQGEGALDSLLRPYLDERDYYGAMNAYLDAAEKTLSRHSTPEEGEKTTSLLSTYSDATGESVDLPIIILIRGITIGLASAFASMAILLMTGVH
ncbi:MAG: TPM domain-containing protein [Clostridiales bacterium]|nr:TPM domain-containing protein [Clostridiales bacterium]